MTDCIQNLQSVEHNLARIEHQLQGELPFENREELSAQQQQLVDYNAVLAEALILAYEKFLLDIDAWNNDFAPCAREADALQHRGAILAARLRSRRSPCRWCCAKQLKALETDVQSFEKRWEDRYALALQERNQFQQQADDIGAGIRALQKRLSALQE